MVEVAAVHLLEALESSLLFPNLIKQPESICVTDSFFRHASTSPLRADLADHGESSE